MNLWLLIHVSEACILFQLITGVGDLRISLSQMVHYITVWCGLKFGTNSWFYHLFSGDFQNSISNQPHLYSFLFNYLCLTSKYAKLLQIKVSQDNLLHWSQQCPKSLLGRWCLQQQCQEERVNMFISHNPVTLIDTLKPSKK